MLPADYIIGFYYTFIPAIAVIFSLVAGLSIKPKGVMINVIQSLAAGVLFAGIAIELLPQLHFHEHALSLSVSVLLGLSLMLILGRLNPDCCSTQVSASPLVPFVTGFSIEFAINGLVIVLSVLASQLASMIASISLAVCCFVCGLSVTTRFITVGLLKSRTIIGVCMMALLFPVGGGLGLLLIDHLSSFWMQEIIAFGMAVLLYIATVDLLPAGLKGKSVWPKVSLYIGFLLIIVINARLH